MDYTTVTFCSAVVPQVAEMLVAGYGPTIVSMVESGRGMFNRGTDNLKF
jgi:hypothetical protein